MAIRESLGDERLCDIERAGRERDGRVVEIGYDQLGGRKEMEERDELEVTLACHEMRIVHILVHS